MASGSGIDIQNDSEIKSCCYVTTVTLLTDVSHLTVTSAREPLLTELAVAPANMSYALYHKSYHYCRDHINEANVGWVCNTHGIERMFTIFQSGNGKERCHWGEGGKSLCIARCQ
jgi:hypothetical protein